MAQNVIELIGIVLVSTQLAADHHLIAEMPRIVNSQTQLMTRSSRSSQSAQSAQSHSYGWHGIEPHVAVLAFKKTDLDEAASTASWTHQELYGYPKYWYVVLSGERIRIYPTPPSGKNNNAVRRADTRGAL